MVIAHWYSTLERLRSTVNEISIRRSYTICVAWSRSKAIVNKIFKTIDSTSTVKNGNKVVLT